MICNECQAFRPCGNLGSISTKKTNSNIRIQELTLQDGIDHLECLVDLLSDLGTSQDDLAADEDQKHNLGLDHAVDETGEQLRLVGAEVVMAGSQTLETNRELDVTRTDDILDLEVCELGVEAELLDDSSVLARSKLRVVLRLCTSHNHLARGEDQGCSLWLTDTHDDGRETLAMSIPCEGKVRCREVSIPSGCIQRFSHAGQSS